MKQRRNSTILAVLLLVIILAGLVGLTWGNLRYVRQNPGGNDFLVHWTGTRLFLTRNISPYSDEAALEIQRLAYGRPAQPGEHELRFAYPFYSILFFFPFAFIADFGLARALYMTLLEVGLIGIALFSLRASRWRPGLVMTGVMLVFSLTWYHGLRPLINGNAVILVGLGLVASFLAVRHKSDELAGIILAFCTIKPQVVLIPGLFLLFWTLGQRRWKMLFWFVGTVGLLSAISALLMGDWILQNIREVLRYPSYNPPGTPGQALATWMPSLGSRIGVGISILVGVILVVEWILSVRRGEAGLAWVFALTLVLSQWSGLQNDPGNYVVLYPALPVIFKALEERWRHVGRVITILTLLLLLVGIWLIFLGTVEQSYQPIQSPVMIFVLPGILLSLLYWVRWWAIAPPKVWADLISEMETQRR